MYCLRFTNQNYSVSFVIIIIIFLIQSFDIEYKFYSGILNFTQVITPGRQAQMVDKRMTKIILTFNISYIWTKKKKKNKQNKESFLSWRELSFYFMFLGQFVMKTFTKNFYLGNRIYLEEFLNNFCYFFSILH